jgi:ketosteroid isomerase-like protein
MFRRVSLGLMFVLSCSASSARADATSDAKAVDEGFFQAVNALDASAALAFYADDARAIYPGEGAEATGKPEIAKLLAAMMKDAKALKLVLKDNQAFSVDDSHLMNLVHWEFAITGRDGKRSLFKGRSTELMVKDAGGVWRYLVDHASVGVPPPPPPKKKARGAKR